jgi:hypothetical protein
MPDTSYGPLAVSHEQKLFVEWVKNSSLNHISSTSRGYQISVLCRKSVFSTFCTCFLHSFYSYIEGLFISLKIIVLLVINIVYKDNNKINISYLLLIKEVI